MDELLETNVAVAFAVHIQQHLENSLRSGLGAQCCHCVFYFYMRKLSPLALIDPTCSLSKRSKYSLISRMSLSVSPYRTYGFALNFGGGSVEACLRLILFADSYESNKI